MKDRRKINMELSREAYKKIKSMNRTEMEKYLNSLYELAHNNGVNAISSKISDKIVKGLENTKGIGKKRMADILDNINKEISSDN